MSMRHVARRVGASLAATAAVGVFALMAFAPPAGAAAPANNTIVPNSAQAVAPFTAGTPFSSGQHINVSVPGGTGAIFTSSQAVSIEECSAPNGVIPSLPSACDGNTVNNGTIFPTSTGAINFTGYEVYALPDSVTFSETSGPPCGSTSATECILYIGDDPTNFTAPHVWSQPFFVTANSDDLGENPGDGTPEVPIAVILPLAAMGLFGGVLLVRRRRAAHNA